MRCSEAVTCCDPLLARLRAGYPQSSAKFILQAGRVKTNFQIVFLVAVGV